MTYDEFQNYIITHLWKMGDAVVIANLPQIIKTAETELNRDLKVEDRVTYVDLTVTGPTVDLPLDCKTVRHLSSLSVGGYKYIIPDDFTAKLAQNRTKGNEYTVANRKIRFVAGGTVENPLTVECWYYRKVANFQALAAVDPDNTSWVAEDYFDAYLYCVLKHTAPFLREDERLQTWGALFGDAMRSILDENEHEVKFAGSPLKMNLSGMRIR